MLSETADAYGTAGLGVELWVDVAVVGGVLGVVADVYDARELVLLGLAGTAVAVLGSLLPAGWAARIRTATALRAEWLRARTPLAALRAVRWVTGPATAR